MISANFPILKFSHFLLDIDSDLPVEPLLYDVFSHVLLFYFILIIFLLYSRRFVTDFNLVFAHILFGHCRTVFWEYYRNFHIKKRSRKQLTKSNYLLPT